MNSQFTIRVNIAQNVGPNEKLQESTPSLPHNRVNKNRAKNIS
jgi:hypothetical protein